MTAKHIFIIGAGPAGSVAAALLRQKGHQVTILERDTFPRFVIGESLLPACMEVLKAAGMVEAIYNNAEKLAFQPKNGAAFIWREYQSAFDFREKFTAGEGQTYQVKRAEFDALLISEAQKQGVEVQFGKTVVGFTDGDDGVRLEVEAQDGKCHVYTGDFVLDASGYGRVLPRLLNLERPSILPPRQACFTHIKDRIIAEDYDREKILISTPNSTREAWLWLIPFADGTSSIGVVGEKHILAQFGHDSESILRAATADVPHLARFLENANWNTEIPFRTVENYSANVSSLYGKHFALLGNASEFLDPVFSSGVTIAMVSAQLAVNALNKQLNGESVDWQTEFVAPLSIGIETFKTYVLGWYDGRFQDVIYNENKNHEIKKMISAILAGYAWDIDNPYVKKPRRRLAALAEVVKSL